MKNLRVHCLAKVLNNDDRKILQDITGFDFIDFDGTYDSIPDETIQDVYEKMSESELEALFEKYGILGVMPYDGKHAIADGIVPKPNVQLRIECKEPVGGAAALGRDGKWYWTFDMRLDVECEFTVTHWEYL
jgi:hypothetical protein